CAIAAGTRPAHLVLANEHVVAFLDERPVFKGHVLAVPRQHYHTLADLPDGLIVPFFGAVRLISAALPGALGAQGSFAATNNVVSQSVPHPHAQIVPRTKGDGLRGFFWPRQRYVDEAEAAGYAERIKSALESWSASQAAGLCRQRNGADVRRRYPGIHG